MARADVLGSSAPRRKLGPTEGSSGPQGKAPPRGSQRNFDRRTDWPPGGRGSIKPGVFGQDGAHGTSAMLFGHHHLEIGRGLVFGFTLTGPPFHKEAVAQTPEHPHNPNAVGGANATAIVVVRDIQALMSAAFNSPGKSVRLEPFLSGQFLGFRTGHQRNQFVFAAFDLPQEQGTLLGQGKADLLGRQRRGADGTALRAALVDFLGASLSWRGLQRGENRPRGP